MRKLMLAGLGFCLMFACQHVKKEELPDAAPKTVLPKVSPDSIVKASVANKKGDTLWMEFHNAKGSADFKFKNETFTLTHDTTGSGIQYSNAEYLYSEWQGESTLKKDGKVIFSNK